MLYPSACSRASRRKTPRNTVSAGPASPPVWKAALPTPIFDVMAAATASSQAFSPSACMMPPTFCAPVSSRSRTAVAM